MDFNEFFEKYINDDSFKEEVEMIKDESSYAIFAEKYGISYPLNEIASLFNGKQESANLDTRTFSKKPIDN